MFDKIQIYNAAISRTGDKTRVISEYDKAPAKLECDKHFPFVLDLLLLYYPFACAHKQIEPTRLDIEPIDDYKYAFELPSDFVKAVKLKNYNRFKIVEPYLYTDIENPKLIYASRISNLATLNASITECIIILLASKIAFSLTQDPQLSQLLLTEFKAVALPAAQMNDMQGQMFNENQHNGWATGILNDNEMYFGGN